MRRLQLCTRLCVMLIGSFSSLSAFAEGTLRLAISGTWGFSVIEVRETDGIVEGELRAGGGSAHVRSYVIGDVLYMETNNQQNTLKFKPSNDGKSIHYSGSLWSPLPSYITVYPNTKDGFQINGTVVNNPFKVWVNKKKRTLDMEWEQSILELKAVAGSPGKCKGLLTDNFIEVAKVNCDSSGTLQDAFLNDHDAVLAWIVQHLIFPLEDAP